MDMKYIRTIEEMDKIHEVAWTNCGYIGFLDTKCGCDISHIYKQADAIEELCDQYVIKREQLVKEDVIQDLYAVCEKMEEVKTIVSLLKTKSVGFQAYGAIWTDKGLIYVAKMNSKGELELL